MEIGTKQEDNNTIWLLAIVIFILFQNFEIILLSRKTVTAWAFLFSQPHQEWNAGSLSHSFSSAWLPFWASYPTQTPVPCPNPSLGDRNPQWTTKGKVTVGLWHHSVQMPRRSQSSWSFMPHEKHFPINTYIGKGGKERKGRRKIPFQGLTDCILNTPITKSPPYNARQVIKLVRKHFCSYILKHTYEALNCKC